MGKGTIKSGGENGLYQVELNYYRDKINRNIAALESRLTALDSQIASEENEQKRNILILQKASVEKQIDYLMNNIPPDMTTSAWCADLTEDLSGKVGTIEIPGEPAAVLIQPGFESNAAYNVSRDGQLLPAVAATPAQFFYNLAMMPGWQKWKPTYRFGTLTLIDGDVADVTLESARSSQQNLDVNQSSTLSGVPIEYMDCNGAAFEEGDSVVIKFEGQNWNSPKVIGFKEEPKPCGFEYIVIRDNAAGEIIVFDPRTGNSATGIKDGDGNEVTFPCVLGLIDGWLSKRESVGNSITVFTYTDPDAPNYSVFSDIATYWLKKGYTGTTYCPFNISNPAIPSPGNPEWIGQFDFAGECDHYFTIPHADASKHCEESVTKTVINECYDNPLSVENYFSYCQQEYGLDPVTSLIRCNYEATWEVSNQGAWSPEASVYWHGPEQFYFTWPSSGEVWYTNVSGRVEQEHVNQPHLYNGVVYKEFITHKERAEFVPNTPYGSMAPIPMNYDGTYKDNSIYGYEVKLKRNFLAYDRSEVFAMHGETCGFILVHQRMVEETRELNKTYPEKPYYDSQYMKDATVTREDRTDALAAVGSFEKMADSSLSDLTVNNVLSDALKHRSSHLQISIVK